MGQMHMHIGYAHARTATHILFKIATQRKSYANDGKFYITKELITDWLTTD